MNNPDYYIVCQAVNTEAAIMKRHRISFPYIAQALLEMTIRVLQFMRDGQVDSVSTGVQKLNQEKLKMDKKLGRTSFRGARWNDPVQRLVTLAINMANGEIGSIVTFLEAKV